MKRKNKSLIITAVKFVYILLFTLSLLCFGIGYHALDTSYNILKLSYAENQDYYDRYYDLTLGGKALTIPYEYIYGWIFIFIAYVLLIGISMRALIE